MPMKYSAVWKPAKGKGLNTSILKVYLGYTNADN